MGSVASRGGGKGSVVPATAGGSLKTAASGSGVSARATTGAASVTGGDGDGGMERLVAEAEKTLFNLVTWHLNIELNEFYK